MQAALMPACWKQCGNVDGYSYFYLYSGRRVEGRSKYVSSALVHRVVMFGLLPGRYALRNPETQQDDPNIKNMKFQVLNMQLWVFTVFHRRHCQAYPFDISNQHDMT